MVLDNSVDHEIARLGSVKFDTSDDGALGSGGHGCRVVYQMLAVFAMEIIE